MVEADRQTALSGQIEPGKLGAPSDESSGLRLSERHPRAIAQLNGAPDEAALAQRLAAAGLVVSLSPNRAAEGKDWNALWNGPGQWLVVSDTLEPVTLIDQLEAALADSDATVTDLSHARSVSRIEGADVREMLAKLCPLDIEAMPAGDCATSLFGQLTALTHCVDDKCFDLYVFRSFGLEMWEALIDEALEFGVHVSDSVT